MKFHSLAGVALIGSCVATLPAAASTPPLSEMPTLRRVELIPMQDVPGSGVPAARDADAADGQDTARGVDPASGPSGAFAVHDLQRRWVAHERPTRFAAPALAPSTNSVDPAPGGEDPFAPIGIAPIAGTLPDAPSMAVPAGGLRLAVPAWMRPATFDVPTGRRYTAGCGATSYRPAGFLSQSIETRRQTYYALMSDIACETGVPAGLFDALILRESQYNPTIWSRKSAYGLTQLMPRTASGLGVNRYDIVDNLRGGARYLRRQLDRFGHYHLALAAYNAGPGRVRGGVVPRIAETQAYVAGILSDWSRLQGAGPAPDEYDFVGSLAATRQQSIRKIVLVSTY